MNFFLQVFDFLAHDIEIRALGSNREVLLVIVESFVQFLSLFVYQTELPVGAGILAVERDGFFVFGDRFVVLLLGFQRAGQAELRFEMSGLHIQYLFVLLVGLSVLFFFPELVRSIHLVVDRARGLRNRRFFKNFRQGSELPGRESDDGHADDYEYRHEDFFGSEADCDLSGSAGLIGHNPVSRRE